MERLHPIDPQNERCAFCETEGLVEVIDFGDVALAGGFLKEEAFARESKFRLRVCFCPSCYAVQVPDKVDPNLLFADYFYFSSAIRTLREHFNDYATEVVARFVTPRHATVLEFGCNDGILLKPLADQGIANLIGVDPALNILKTIDDPRINTVHGFFNESLVEELIGRFGKADLVLANNVFAHIPDINGVTRAVERILKDDGVFVFEVHYLGKIIQDLQYDMIYHEHLYYYSLLALENHFARHGMTVFDIKPIPIHGGSMRYYVCKKNSFHAKDISVRVHNLRNEERALGYDRPETYTTFAANCADRRQRLMDLLTRLRAKGRTIAGYGASGRANTIIQYCGIGREHLEYMIDDAPAKHGYSTPGSHLTIRSNDVLRTDPPDYLLIFAWSFFNEIAAKSADYVAQGGRLMVPLPDVRITFYPTSDDLL
ncbi:class I SAM-dependent methyltransferase [Bradyrhizobium sp. CIAT3101]|uniref:class I SAM-dependent methyltransferase n=1 Tax=Bradyrhizobium sp. CIAT3101 TaxID=439387 RepID=UPI0024B0F430|nr:class I SAM-dependent methyltransferase [Bradyrhizobium sp. CIAT3101]WFU83841.1 class I SAM-dependent methyltransferase [Bradyrhizobium sp. CIAT3101]